MTVSSEYFAMAATAFKEFYPDPASLTINTDAHVCPTYVATVSSAKDEPFILQFRIREHALVDPATYEVVERSLGSFAPKFPSSARMSSSWTFQPGTSFTSSFPTCSPRRYLEFAHQIPRRG